MGKSELSCDCTAIHQDVIDVIREHLPPEEAINNLSDLFKAFGDNTRMTIILALRREEMCVCDLAVLLNMTKSAVSHQLKVLREEKVVSSRREGKQIYYTIASPRVRRIIRKAVNLLNEFE